MIVAGYTLGLYCEVPGHIHGYKEGEARYAGDNWRECVRYARKDGWYISEKLFECVCPKCAAAGLRPSGPTPPGAV